MTEPEPTNWGILSTARIGVTAFIPSARATPGARVQAVASRSREKAEAFAREHDIPLALGGYQALVEHPDVDAIYISLPNSLHAEWTIAAARAGKHVFCEKPLAVTAEEGRRMAAACGEAGVLLFEAFVFMHHPQSRRIREILGTGEIGALRHIDAGMAFVVDDPANIRLIKALGGGSIYDGGVYPITFARFVAGDDPVSVMANMRFDERSGVDVAVSLILEFPGNLTATLYCGFQGRGGAHARIIGDRGRLVRAASRSSRLPARSAPRRPAPGPRRFSRRSSSSSGACAGRRPPRTWPTTPRAPSGWWRRPSSRPAAAGESIWPEGTVRAVRDPLGQGRVTPPRP